VNNNDNNDLENTITVNKRVEYLFMESTP